MSSFPTPRRGEIWLVDFSPQRERWATPRAGHPERLWKPEPSLSEYNRPRDEHQGRTIPFHVPVEPSELNGLREITHVKCEQVLTVSKARLLGGKPLGRVESAKLREVEVAVKLAMALP